MEWIKAIFAIIFFVGVMCFLPLESIAQVATDKAITITSTKEQSETFTYEQLLQVKKQLEDAIASISSKQEQLEKVNLMIAQIEAEKAKVVVKELPKVVSPLVK
jgi:hypothetical protein